LKWFSYAKHPNTPNALAPLLHQLLPKVQHQGYLNNSNTTRQFSNPLVELFSLIFLISCLKNECFGTNLSNITQKVTATEMQGKRMQLCLGESECFGINLSNITQRSDCHKNATQMNATLSGRIRAANSNLKNRAEPQQKR
jgi:hypothetical protein